MKKVFFRTVFVFAFLTMMIGTVIVSERKSKAKEYTYIAEKTITMDNKTVDVNLKPLLKSGDRLAKKCNNKKTYLDTLRIKTGKTSIVVNQYSYNSTKVYEFQKDHEDLSIPTAKGGVIRLHINLHMNDRQRLYAENRYYANGLLDIVEPAEGSIPPIMSDILYSNHSTRRKVLFSKTATGYMRFEPWYYSTYTEEDEKDKSDKQHGDFIEKCIVEYYNPSFEVISSKIIELSEGVDGFGDKSDIIWGGVYAGSRFNYLVVGMENPEDRKDKEVIRILKFDSEWNYLKYISLSGLNTSIPFRLGNVSFAESGDMLYIHTAHQMFKSQKDGLKHQANLRITINQATDTVAETHHEVGGGGYVSHAFYQFIVTDNNDIYSFDMGDKYPRGYYIAKFKNKAGKVLGNPNSSQTIPDLQYPPCDFSVTDKSVMLLYWDTEGCKDFEANIKLITLDKEKLGSSEVNTVILKKNTNNGGFARILKLSDDKYAIVWNSKGKIIHSHAAEKFGYVVVDGKGNILSEEKEITGILDPDTLTQADGKLVWYRTGNHYRIDSRDALFDSVYDRLINTPNMTRNEINKLIEQQEYSPYASTPPVFCVLDPMIGEFSQKMIGKKQVDCPQIISVSNKGKILFEGNSEMTVHLWFNGKEYTTELNKTVKKNGITIGGKYSGTMTTTSKIKGNGDEDDGNYVLIWATKEGMCPSGKIVGYISYTTYGW